MKNVIILTCLFFASSVSAQVLYNNGASLTIKTGGTLQVNGAAQFQSGSTLTNDGSLIVKGNVISNQVMTAANAGILTLDGTSAQTLSGSGSYFAKNVIVNNANGITLNMPLKLDGICNFNNGIMNAALPVNAVTFTTNASVSGTNTPKNSSHINGYVVKEGTGSFSYPVGDGTRYEPVNINLSSNAGGMRVKYNAADAGAGSFTAGGTEAVALASYSTQEYWDATPLSTATGTVQIFWDGYKDSYSNAVNQRRVAHKVGANWLNEGSAITATGTKSSGSVTSNNISSWSPFALGSVVAVLPVKWLSVNGSLNSFGLPVIRWKVAETNVIEYEIQKSFDGMNFKNIGTVTGKGDGTNDYDFTEASVLNGTAYYRIEQEDADGRRSWSAVVTIKAGKQNTVTVFPNPFTSFVIITAEKATVADVLDLQGRIVKTFNLNEGRNRIGTNDLLPGVYVLRTADGQLTKLVKQ